MDLTNDKIKENIANNLVVLRRRFQITQLELATILNYSDKSISKWERAEGVPDIYVIYEICNFFHIKVDQFITLKLTDSSKVIKRIKQQKFNRIDFFRTIIITSLIWVLAILTYLLISLFSEKSFPIIFIYALPVTSLALYIFYQARKLYWYAFGTLSAFLWTLLLSFALATSFFDKSYLFFIIGAPLQILIFAIYAFHFTKERNL